MPSEIYTKSACAQCGGHIEFPAHAAGMTVPCPHCGKPTSLTGPVKKKTGLDKRVFICVAAALFLAGATAEAIVAIRHAQRVAEEKRQNQVAAQLAAERAREEAERLAKDPIERAGFHVADVMLRRHEDNSFLYATGTLKNKTDRRRFGVKVELELYDANGQKTGEATDYTSTLEPRSEWRFNALVLVDTNAASAKVVAVMEQ